MSSTCNPTSWLTARDATMCSLPGKPATSDMRTLPPAATTRSVIAPMTGFAESAVVQSDPPHWTPTTRSATRHGTRSCDSQRALSLRTMSTPFRSASGDPPSRWIRMASTGFPVSATHARTSSMFVCSHPRPTSSTAPTLGLRPAAMSASFVRAWSCSNSQHPCSWTTGMVPVVRAIRSVTVLEHETIEITRT